MSLQAERQRGKRHIWAAPGSSHDRLIRPLKRILPIAMGVLTAFLAIAPFTHRSEVSFVLDKNKVEVARERMRVRSEEHTSELQSLMRISYAGFCLKKKKTKKEHTISNQ